MLVTARLQRFSVLLNRELEACGLREGEAACNQSSQVGEHARAAALGSTLNRSLASCFSNASRAMPERRLFSAAACSGRS